MKRTRWWPVIWAAVLSVTMAGCVRIPVDGPVETVPQRTRKVEAPVVLEPQPPALDASPDDIIEGFMQAMTQARGDYSVARQFLTAQAAVDWQPGRQVLIYADEAAPTVEGAVATISTQIVARLDERGSYRREDRRLVHDFKIVKLDGQWRISAPPDGLLLANYWFNSAFDAVTVYFWDPAGRALVPDRFYLPRGRRTPGDLIQTLLSGPSQWLQPAVQAVPRRVRLARTDLSVAADGSLRVPLTSDASSLAPQLRSMLARQIAVTLLCNTLPDAVTQRLTLEVEGVPLGMPDADADGGMPLSRFEGDRPTLLDASTTLYGVVGGRLSTLDSRDSHSVATPLPGRLGAPIAGIGEIAVNASESRLAWEVNGRGIFEADLSSGTMPTQPLLAVPSISQPQYTRFDELFFLARQGGVQRLYRLHNKSLEQVAAPALAGIDVDSLAISPDGVHVAISGVKAGTRVVGLGLLIRGNTLRLDGWRPVRFDQGSSGPAQVISVDWRTDTSLAVLGRPKDARQVVPYAADPDGRETLSGSPPREWAADRIVTSPFTEPPMATVLASDGQMWSRIDEREWRADLTSVTALTYPN